MRSLRAFRRGGWLDQSELNEASQCGCLGGVVGVVLDFPICALAVCEAGLGVTSSFVEDVFPPRTRVLHECHPTNDRRDAAS